MCIIIAKLQNDELPCDEYIKNAANVNGDGIGIAYWKNGANEVHIKKTFENVEEFIPWVKENIRLEDVCIMHFRRATQGLIDKGNRHPFPLTKNWELLRKTELVCQQAGAHNGVLEQYTFKTDKKYSDTQKFIYDILSEETCKNNLYNEPMQKLINCFLAGDKLVVLDNVGQLLFFGNWIVENNIYYSNKSYLPVEKTIVPYKDIRKNWAKCSLCNSFDFLKYDYRTESTLCDKCTKEQELSLTSNSAPQEEEIKCKMCQVLFKEKDIEKRYVIEYNGNTLCIPCFNKTFK